MFNLLQTDAPINHGNSGGALLDGDTGKVCGITNSMISNNDGNIGIGQCATVAAKLRHIPLPPSQRRTWRRTFD